MTGSPSGPRLHGDACGTLPAYRPISLSAAVGGRASRTCKSSSENRRTQVVSKPERGFALTKGATGVAARDAGGLGVVFDAMEPVIRWSISWVSRCCRCSWTFALATHRRSARPAGAAVLGRLAPALRRLTARHAESLGQSFGGERAIDRRRWICRDPLTSICRTRQAAGACLSLALG